MKPEEKIQEFMEEVLVFLLENKCSAINRRIKGNYVTIEFSELTPEDLK